MDKQIITSTSPASAQCSDIILRATGTTRLIFRPQLVENPNDKEAGVRGRFIFQRKGPNDEWGVTATIPLSTLKKDEGYRLELRSTELLKLFSELGALYRIHAKTGVQIGTTEYVRADSLVNQLTDIPAADLRTYLATNEALGLDLLSKLLGWATTADDPSVLIQRLVSIAPGNLRKLNAAVGLESIKSALAIWDHNRHNDDEEFWQRFLTEHSFLLEQVFSWPVTIVKGKAYVGGKSILNTGDGVVDFLLKNEITNNAALVEIKTPATALLGGEYRNRVYNLSNDLSGSIQQVAQYSHSSQLEYHAIAASSPTPLSTFAPKCVVVIGNAGAEFSGNSDKSKALELFRGNLTGITVVTFDELFQKTSDLVEILELPSPAAEGHTEEVTGAGH